MLKAVFFDLDNTLIDRDAAFRECIQSRFDDVAVRAELFRLDHGGRGDRETLFSYWSQHTGAPMNQEKFAQMLAEQIKPDAELLDALRRLTKILKLGIITNGGGESQRRKYRAAGLSDVIPESCVWVSAEVGVAKPDPAIFRLACWVFGALPGECLFLGDDEHNDIAGAIGAGMKARRVDSVLDAGRLVQLLSEEEFR